MCHSRKLNNKINNLHYRALKMVYNDHTSSFDELLEKDGLFTIHHRNIQYLAIEMYKVLDNLSPSFLQEISTKNINLASDNVSAKTYLGLCFIITKLQKLESMVYKTIICLGPKIFNMLPDDIKIHQIS